jgi:hypothetical protein
VIFMASWAAWLVSSGNGRYLFPMTFIVGILPVALWWPTRGRFNRVFAYAVLTVCLIQLIQFNLGASLRWAPEPWGDHWIEVQVPASLQRGPFLFVATDSQSPSWLVPFLAPASAMVQVSGQQAIGLEGPGSQKLQGLLSRYKNRSYMLAKVTANMLKPDRLATTINDLHFRIARLGLRIDAPNACLQIRLRSTEPVSREYPGVTSDEIPFNAQERSRGTLDLPSRKTKDRAGWVHFLDTFIPDPFAHWSTVLACPVVPSPAAAVEHEAATAPIDQVLDRVEFLCPNIFSPSPQITERRGQRLWLRSYSGTDVNLTVYDNKVHYQDIYHGGPPTELGTLSDWSGPNHPPINCQHRYSRIDQGSFDRP